MTIAAFIIGLAVCFGVLVYGLLRIRRGAAVWKEEIEGDLHPWPPPQEVQARLERYIGEGED